MGFVSQIFGANGGAANADIAKPVTADQANASLSTAQVAQQQQQALHQQLAAQNGIQNQSDVFSSLGQVANGSINPAQNQLNQNTAANTATQASLMAGQRGVGDNTGLLARNAAMNGAANQQQAIGQAATMQSQNQLNAMGQQAGIAQNQVGNQMQATGANTQAAQGLYGQQLNSINATNNTLEADARRKDTATQAMNAQNNANGMAVLGGAMAGASGGMSMLGGMGGGGASPVSQFSGMMAGGPGDAGGMARGTMNAAHGGTIPGGSITDQLKHAKMMKDGGVVPGQAKVNHDSYRNDTVSAKLSPGEVVIDKDTLKAKGKVGDAARLLQAYLAKTGHKPKVK